MQLKLIKASQEYKHVLENLMQFYLYDFSEFVELDVQEDALFKPYPHLYNYWEEENNWFPYIIMENEKYAGFVLVRWIASANSNHFSIAEFLL